MDGGHEIELAAVSPARAADIYPHFAQRQESFAVKALHFLLNQRVRLGILAGEDKLAGAFERREAPFAVIVPRIARSERAVVEAETLAFPSAVYHDAGAYVAYRQRFAPESRG